MDKIPEITEKKLQDLRKAAYPLKVSLNTYGGEQFICFGRYALKDYRHAEIKLAAIAREQDFINNKKNFLSWLNYAMSAK